MLKNKKLIIIVLLLLILFVPIPFHLKDGGTVEYRALTYQISNVHKLNHNAKDGYDTGIIIKIFGIKLFDNVKESKNINNDNSKSIVVYFSNTGNTKRVADFISDITDSEMVEIIPKEKYTSEDLNYNNDNSRANKEQNDFNARPEIKNDIDVSSYDIIYLGYPIWWGDVPKIILTFLDTHNLNGKTIIPFCTSGSTGIENSINTLKKYNKNVNWINGKRFSSSTTRSEIESFINNLDY